MATVSPTGRRATGWGAGILRTALAFKGQKDVKEFREREQERVLAVDKAMGTHRAATLRLQQDQLDATERQNQSLNAIRSQSAQRSEDQLRLNQQIATSNAMRAAYGIQWDALDEGKIETPEMYDLRVQIDTAMKSMQGQDMTSILQSQSIMMPINKPEDDMTEEEKSIAAMGRTLIPGMLAQGVDPTVIRNIAKQSGLDVGEFRYAPETADQLTIVDWALVGSRLHQAGFSPASIAPFISDAIKGTQQIGPQLEPKADLDNYTLYEIQKMTDQGDISTPREQALKRQDANRRDPGGNSQWIDVNPGRGTSDIRLVPEAEFEAAIKNPGVYGYYGRFSDKEIKTNREIYRKGKKELTEKSKRKSDATSTLLDAYENLLGKSTASDKVEVLQGTIDALFQEIAGEDSKKKTNERIRK